MPPLTEKLEPRDNESLEGHKTSSTTTMSSEHEIAISETVMNGLPANRQQLDPEADPSKVSVGKGSVTLRTTSGYVEPLETDTSPNLDPQQMPSKDSAELPSSETDGWMPPSTGETNGEATPSSLAAKGFRSVRPNLPSDHKAQPQPPPVPLPPREESFAWCPSNKVKLSYFAPVPILDYVHIRPEPSRGTKEPVSLCPSTTLKSSLTGEVPLSTRTVPRDKAPAQRWVPAPDANPEAAGWLGIPAVGPSPERKVSNLYIALTRRTLPPASGGSACRLSQDVAVPAPTVPLPVSSTASFAPPVPQGPMLQVSSPWAGHSSAKPDLPQVDPPPEPLGRSSALDRERTPVIGLKPAEVLSTARGSPPQWADRGSGDLSAALAQCEVNSWSSRAPAGAACEREESPCTPLPPLVSAEQASSSSPPHLTLPTLDDFIPPHLQKGVSHSPCSSTSTSPINPPVPSLPLPATNLHSATDSELSEFPPPTDVQPRVSEGVSSIESVGVHPIISSSSRLSAYPSTTSVNPTIVLLQHNREQQKRLNSQSDSVPDRLIDQNAAIPAAEGAHTAVSTGGVMDSRRQKTPRIPHSSFIAPEDLGIKSVERPKDWYKTMFKQIHKVSKDTPEENPYRPTYSFPEIPERQHKGEEENPYTPSYVFPETTPSPKSEEKETYTPTYVFSEVAKREILEDDELDDYSPRYPCSEDVKSQTFVPRSRSAMDTTDSETVERRSATLPLPTRSSSLKPLSERSNWGPLDKKVDTRRYRAEPKSIFDYEPGKSSVLAHEKTNSEESGGRDSAQPHIKDRTLSGKCDQVQQGNHSHYHREDLSRDNRDISPEEIDLKNEPWYKFFSELEFGKPPPKKIWDYTPGECSILSLEDRKDQLEKDLSLYQAELDTDLENMEKLFRSQDPRSWKSTTLNSALEIPSERSTYSVFSPSYHAVSRPSEVATGESITQENERQIYKTVLEGGDIPFQGLSGLNKRTSSSSSAKVDFKGAIGHSISTTPINSTAVNSSYVLGYKCKAQKSLSAAKACISEILPSKFRPMLPVNNIPTQDREGASPQKAQSCENLLSVNCLLNDRGVVMKETGRSFESLLLKGTQEPSLCLSGDRRLQKSATIARRCPVPNGFVDDAARFIKLQQNMHQMSHSRPQGAGSAASVRDVAIRLECSPTVQDEQNTGQEESDSFPRCSVSSRVSQFEQIIQRSRSMPSLDLSSSSTSVRSPVPSLSTSFMQLTQSAESLLDLPARQCEKAEPDVQITIHRASASGSEVEEVASELSEVVVTKSLSPRPDIELDCLSRMSADSCTSTCQSVNTHTAAQHQGACLTSGTGFIALLKQEGQTADPPSTMQHLPPPLSRNLYLLSPRPFRLKKPFLHRVRNPLTYVDSSSQTEVDHKIGSPLDNPVAQGPLSNTKPSHPMRTTSFRVVKTLRPSAVTGQCRGNGILQPDLSKGSASGSRAYLCVLDGVDPNNSRHSELGMYPQGGLSSNSPTLSVALSHCVSAPTPSPLTHKSQLVIFISVVSDVSSPWSLFFPSLFDVSP
ncbi:sorbin and SH3 domain-containing protein 1 isoform X6 [Pristis pectinata]|uniref:sorbin and SH3 domain-containing protein 1 isoform X6 n=2 Tax=Pristis pectinata TaxID=685728 RepID=UPI00223D0364|nr:sorbin and SH3 domain-containing protein 1 isoform X6 [Pristis pectinata]